MGNPRSCGSAAALRAGVSLLAVLASAVAAVPQAMAQAQRPAAEPAVAIELVVERVASTAVGAQAASELAARRVVHALTGSGVPVGEIGVQGTVLVAERAWPGVIAITTIRDDHRIVGYRALTPIRVEAPDARHLGLLVDLAQGAGATRVLDARAAGPATAAPR